MKVYIGTDSEGEACITREKDPRTVYGTWQADEIRLWALSKFANHLIDRWTMNQWAVPADQ